MAVRRILAIVICLGPIVVSGCSMLHDLQPHRLRRMNRGSPPHLDPEFTQRDRSSEVLVARAQNEEAQELLPLGFQVISRSDRD